MVTLADSLVSSSARKLPIRKRPDLSATRQHYLGRSYWVVKDPVGLHYFRFQEEEYAILQMLDGETSLDEIKDAVRGRVSAAEDHPRGAAAVPRHAAPQRAGDRRRAGPGRAAPQAPRRAHASKSCWAAVTNILCIRFKGIDPERLLNWLYP